MTTLAYRQRQRLIYSTAEKEQYRWTVWQYMAGAVVDPAQCRALLLPARGQDEEIKVAVACGFRLENLYVVNRNSQIVSHVTRQFPGVHTFGIPLARAAKALARQRVTLHCANIDLMGWVSRLQLATLEAFAAADVIVPGGVIGVNVLRAREQRPTTVRWRVGADDFRAQPLSPADVVVLGARHNFERLRLIGRALGMPDHVTLGRCGQYESPYAGCLTMMLWSLWRRRPISRPAPEILPL